MKLSADALLELLGPLKNAAQDPSVIAIHLHGAGASVVEREQATAARGASLDAGAVESLAHAVRRHAGAPGPAASALLAGGLEVTVLDAPHLPGGAVITIHTGHVPRTQLDDLGPDGLTRTLHALVVARLSVLVVGADRRARRGALQALASATPPHARLVVVENPAAPSVRHPGAVALSLPDARAVSAAAVFGALPSLRPDWLCLPDLSVATLPALHAACICPATFAAMAASDAEAALALLTTSHPTAAPLAVGAFRALLEVTSLDGRVQVRSLREPCRLPDGRTALTTLFSESAPDGWVAVPAFAPRLTFNGPPPWSERAPEGSPPVAALPAVSMGESAPLSEPDLTFDDITAPRTQRAADARAEARLPWSDVANSGAWDDDTATGTAPPSSPTLVPMVTPPPRADALLGQPTAQMETPVPPAAADGPSDELQGLVTAEQDRPAILRSEHASDTPDVPPPTALRPSFRESPSFRGAPGGFKESASYRIGGPARARPGSPPPMPVEPRKPGTPVRAIRPPLPKAVTPRPTTDGEGVDLMDVAASLDEPGGNSDVFAPPRSGADEE